MYKRQVLPSAFGRIATGIVLGIGRAIGETAVVLYTKMCIRDRNEALSRELTGLEFAVGIPGTVGGAISMNAGSRTEWIGSLVRDVVTYKPVSYTHLDVYKRQRLVGCVSSW